MLVKKLTFDKDDRVFFVGDVHGRYTLLMEQLNNVGFDIKRGDKLISVGDLIDSGFENDQTLSLISEPWVDVAEGNHEKMMRTATKNMTKKDFEIISSFLIDQNGLQKLQDIKDDIAGEEVHHEVGNTLSPAEIMWISNGGAWFYDVFETKGFKYRKAQADSLASAKLPIAIEVHHPLGLVGVVHAGIKSNNWNMVGAIARIRPSQLLWMRDHITAFEEGRSNAYKAGFVKGVDALVVGHSIPRGNVPLVLANTMYIDVNAKAGKAPFVIEIRELLKAVFTVGLKTG